MKDPFNIDNGIRQIGSRWAFICWAPGYFYFRVFGYGLHFKNWIQHGLLFSERMRIQTYPQQPIWIFGNWIVRRLRPDSVISLKGMIREILLVRFFWKWSYDRGAGCFLFQHYLFDFILHFWHWPTDEEFEDEMAWYSDRLPKWLI